MRLVIVCEDTRVKHMNKNDVGLSSKYKLGCKSGTLSQRITLKVDSKINTKWKTRLTALLLKHKRSLLLNSRPMVYIADDSLRDGDKIVSFSFRNMAAFSNEIANYILRKRRYERDEYGKVTRTGILTLAKSLK